MPSGGIALRISASVGNGIWGFAAGAAPAVAAVAAALGGGEAGSGDKAPFSLLIFLVLRPPSEVATPSVSEPSPRMPDLRFLVGAVGADDGIGGDAGREGGWTG